MAASKCTRALCGGALGTSGQCTVSGGCNRCDADISLTVPEDGLMDWYFGADVQVALPQLDADQREWLISGICGKCFEAIWQEATA